MTCWNQKFLDYEIETLILFCLLESTSLRWNQKFLDYEIETTACAGSSRFI